MTARPRHWEVMSMSTSHRFSKGMSMCGIHLCYERVWDSFGVMSCLVFTVTHQAKVCWALPKQGEVQGKPLCMYPHWVAVHIKEEAVPPTFAKGNVEKKCG